MRSARMSRSAWVAAAILMAAGSLTVAVPAQADTFTPQAGPPSINLNNAYPQFLQPATPRSSTIYEVTATIGSTATVADLDQVTMCWHKGDSTYSPATASCLDAATDPKSEFLMTWTRSTNTFAVAGTNHYADAGSTSTYGTGDGQTMDVTFKFQVSDGMLAGTDWLLSVGARDSQGQGGFVPRGGNTVNYWGAVTTQRASQDYGTLLESWFMPAERSVLREDVSDGAFVANGTSGIMLEATNFTGPGAPLLMDNGPNATMPVMPDRVALDCNRGATFSEGTAVRVGNSPQTIEFPMFAEGTGETPDTTLVNSCRLQYGGGATVANQQYSNTVTVGVGGTN